MQPRKTKNYGQKWLPTLDAQVSAEATANQRPNGMPGLSMIKNYVKQQSLEEADAIHLYDCWLMNGFKTRTGNRIHDWRAAIRVWKQREYFPSQRRLPKVTDKERQQAAIKRMREGK